jgi:predicted RNA-binding Zn-ribbon protein involved in translation (DUF1610 family)
MESSKLKYCPSCGKQLEKVEIVDVHAKGYKCENGHYLHSLQDVYTGQTMGSYLDLKSDKDAPADILKEWLSNFRLRDHLNDNLANIIRVILDTKDGKQSATEQYRYDYCPTCGDKFQNVPTDDLYVAILKCGHEHTFLSRGGLRSASDPMTAISFDYDKKYFEMSYESWMEDKNYQEYFPHELKRALQTISL